MGEKDVTARHLMQIADVFADIVNGSIFNLTGGWPSPLVRPEDLVDVPTSNISVSGGRVRGLERDVAKLWTVGGTVICLTGLEHQTRVDPDMPFRVFGYEGADYHRQLAERDAEAKARARRGKRRNKLYPVLTIVLYFGTKRPWPKNRLSLLDRFPDMREFIRPLANDCHLNMVDVPRLTPNQRTAYRSVCRICQDKDFEPGDQELVHVEETVRFLSALTGDRGLIRNLPNIIQQGGKPMTVRNVFGEVRRQSRAEGRAEGLQIGEVRGEVRGIQIGKAQGGLNMLVSLVHDGLLRLGDAAKKAGMSEDEFKIRMREQQRTGEA